VPAARSDAKEVRSELVQLYSQPQRRYHTLEHIADCLGHLDRVRTEAQDPDALELALWFHDAIHVAGARDNEERSVAFFDSVANGMEAARAGRIRDFIMATKHALKEAQADCGYMVDIDLAGFGAPWDEFMRKGDALREEYVTQSDPEYYTGQVGFLRRLRDRPHFFRTPHFRNRYETMAQDNLSRLMALRNAQGYGSAS
jgi:predicted metal-dependent HD superfamily phosphohydrolase